MPMCLVCWRCPTWITMLCETIRFTGIPVNWSGVEDNPYLFQRKSRRRNRWPSYRLRYDLADEHHDESFYEPVTTRKSKTCVEMLVNTDAGTGFMHESFHKNDPTELYPCMVCLAKHVVRRIDIETDQRGKG